MLGKLKRWRKTKSLPSNVWLPQRSSICNSPQGWRKRGAPVDSESHGGFQNAVIIIKYQRRHPYLELGFTSLNNSASGGARRLRRLSVRLLVLTQVMISRFVSLSSALGSVSPAQRPLWILCPPLPAPPRLALSLKNKYTLKNNHNSGSFLQWPKKFVSVLCIRVCGCARACMGVCKLLP